MWTLGQVLEALFSAIDKLFRHVHTDFETVHNRIDNVRNRLDQLEHLLQKVSRNSAGRLEIRAPVKFFGAGNLVEIQGEVKINKDLEVQGKTLLRDDLRAEKDLTIDSELFLNGFRMNNLIP